MPRSNSNTYLGNKKLKAEGVTQNFTLKQLQEYQKCADDPIYFIKHYVKIVSLDKGEILFNLYPFQEQMIRNFTDNRFNILKISRQCGKCLQKSSCIHIRDRKTGTEKSVSIRKFYLINKYPRFYKIMSALQNAFSSLFT